MNFQKILNKYRDISFSERDKGTRFERLMQAYLKTDPRYAFKFKHVWLWNEFPSRSDLGSIDTGIDLVALTHEGEYWAIQCKCFQETATINKAAVDTFLSSSSRQFKDENGLYASFGQRLWISTTNKWGSNAEEAIKRQNPPVSRINLFDLIESPVDWNKIEKGVHGELARTPKKSLRPHQKEALEQVHEHFKSADRGKLIMACGTGKTFSALRIAEHETDGKGLILFLVPSIALLGQTLREWSADANEPINAICICSDPAITTQRKRNIETDSFSIVDLAMPASTDTEYILEQFKQISENNNSGMTVVFSTYQSIDVLQRAQAAWLEKGFPEFDLIVCDEAHRTTGVSLSGEDESAFTKVHDSDFIKAKKRLYMTATPRLYNDESKSKAAQADATLCSMDDANLYGEEMYRIGFGEAVERDMLTDYKVLILTLSEKDIPPALQESIANGEKEINSDDAIKLIGTVNALSKQMLNDEGGVKEADPEPMKRAVAFCSNIKTSKKISSRYNEITADYVNSLPLENQDEMVSISSQHMDGTMAAPERDRMLSWLKEEAPGNECRIITNVRVLSEGVDVPSLDSVLFLSARNSPVDVVQSVGRVMRKSPGKKYGYIIIPVVAPSSISASEALDDNERYKVVWTVLNALRAHDDRFNATVNKIELNRKRPNNIVVGRPNIGFDEDGNPFEIEKENTSKNGVVTQLQIQFEQLQSAVFARMVKKVGDRKYWEEWAKEVADVVKQQINQITDLVDNNSQTRKAFEFFLHGLQNNLNPKVDKVQAIEMLAQHVITKPIFEALFEDYSFADTNVVSVSMQKMLNELQDNNPTYRIETLSKFYKSVQMNISNLDNAEAKQKIIIRIYDDFFKKAFPDLVDKLGIVYTPIEIVDYIIHSVNDLLKQEFDCTLTDEHVNILDPFTGTGTFITRLLQSGLIESKDLLRKYKSEIHANELVLLAYYIAAVNIENAFHDIYGTINKDSLNEYKSFDGIVLTDTFQLGEVDNVQTTFSDSFPQNSERVEIQKKAPLRVIIGNPPYSIGQKSANDNAQNQKYNLLDNAIASSYADLSTYGLNKSLYDAYIRAFRWSSDRLDSDSGGVIAFVSNGKWLVGNSMDGFRKSLENEFSSIYVYDLRGDQRGDWRKEGGKVFGEGSQTRIAITFLVKKPNHVDKAEIYYQNIGDYLTKEEKLHQIKNQKSLRNPKSDWVLLKPNEHGDWLEKRGNTMVKYDSLAPKKKFDVNSESIFVTNAIGVSTNRDSWTYNYSNVELLSNMGRMISVYNSQIDIIKKAIHENSNVKLDSVIEQDRSKIGWTVNLKNQAKKGILHSMNSESVTVSMYRPFNKEYVYFDRAFIERPGLSQKFYPEDGTDNLVIAISGIGASKGFSVLMSNLIVNMDSIGKTQCFPLYYFEKQNISEQNLFEQNDNDSFIRRDGISDSILAKVSKKYKVTNIEKVDLFYYVYGVLHSLDYRKAFENDLSKMLPRIPFVTDITEFWQISKIGRQLSDLHINYECQPNHSDVFVVFSTISKKEIQARMSGSKVVDIDYSVRKMRFADKNKSSIVFNTQIVIENIPAKAYEYVVNGKSAIEWIMERYQVRTDKHSGIVNDPNAWGRENSNPKYILNLLLSVINVSIQTVDIVNSLPKLNFDK